MEQLGTSTLSLLEEENKEMSESIQYIVIRLGNEQYGIDIRYVDNIVRMQRMTRVPKVAAFLRGVINLRGEVIPVMSIRLRMGLEEAEDTKATRIIILKLEQEGNVGIVVDEVREVVTLNVDSIEKLTNGSKDNKVNFISAVGRHNNELISLLDLSTITLDENI